MNPGDNISTDMNLDLLDDDLDISLEDLQPQPSTSGQQTDDDIDDKTKKPSEEETPESVAADKKDLDKGTSDKSDSSSPGGDALPQLYSSLATHLKDTGVLPSLEDTKGVTSLEQLQEAIAKEVEKNAGELQTKYKEAMEGGVETDIFVSYQKTKNQLDSITDEVLSSQDDRAVNLRFNIIAQDFINKGHTKEEASKLAKRSVDLAEDVEDAKSALQKLKDFNEARLSKAQEEASKRVEREQSEIKKFIDSTDEIFKGIKLSKNIKDKLYDQMVKTVGSTEDNKPLNEYTKAYKEDPVKFQVIQNYLFMLTKGFTDFSKINTAATKTVSREIDDVLKSTGSAFFQGGQFQQGPDKNSTFNIGDGFDIDV